MNTLNPIKPRTYTFQLLCLIFFIYMLYHSRYFLFIPFQQYSSTQFIFLALFSCFFYLCYLKLTSTTFDFQSLYHFFRPFSVEHTELVEKLNQLNTAELTHLTMTVLTHYQFKYPFNCQTPAQSCSHTLFQYQGKHVFVCCQPYQEDQLVTSHHLKRLQHKQLKHKATSTYFICFSDYTEDCLAKANDYNITLLTNHDIAALLLKTPHLI